MWTVGRATSTRPHREPVGRRCTATRRPADPKANEPVEPEPIEAPEPVVGNPCHGWQGLVSPCRGESLPHLAGFLECHGPGGGERRTAIEIVGAAVRISGARTDSVRPEVYGGVMERTLRLLELLAAGRSTAAWLAHTIGCSVRTVYREVARLRAAGWAIVSVPGPHGGFWLCAGSRPAPVRVSREDAREAALALSVLHRLQGGASPTGSRALIAVVGALSPADRAGLQALMGHLVVEGMGTGPPVAVAAPVFDALQGAAGGRQEVLCANSVGPERFAPTGLALRAGVWNVVCTGLRSPGRRIDHPGMELSIADLRHVRVRKRLADSTWRARPSSVSGHWRER